MNFGLNLSIISPPTSKQQAWIEGPIKTSIFLRAIFLLFINLIDSKIIPFINPRHPA